MSVIAVYVLVAGLGCAAIGLALQLIGAVAFTRFSAEDTKELAGVAGLRVSAIFGIAVGLVFSGSHVHYTEANRDLLEQVRLVGTLYVFAVNAPNLPNTKRLREQLRQYVQASASDLDYPNNADQSADATNRLLYEVCKLATSQKLSETDWYKTQIQSSCASLIELRGKERIGMLMNNVETPFWIFFVLSFGFLAFLLGVFSRRPLNLLFSTLFYFVVGVTGLLIYWMGDPYHGPSRISSEPLTKLIAKMDTLDKGPQL